MQLFNFKTAVVKSGSKVTDESKPLLYVTSTMNSFKLNKKALQALGIGVGDRVVLLDAGKQASDNNMRFFICKNFTVDGKEMGSLISKTQGFNYSVVYGAMLAQDLDVISIGAQQMVEAGLLYPKNETKNTQYVATKTAVCDIVPFNDGELVEVADGVELPMFLITNFNFSDHESRVNDDESELEDELDVE